MAGGFLDAVLAWLERKLVARVARQPVAPGDLAPGDLAPGDLAPGDLAGSSLKADTSYESYPDSTGAAI